MSKESELMRVSLRHTSLIFACLAVACSNATAGLTVTIKQNGANVVAESSGGTINTTALAYSSTTSDLAEMRPMEPMLIIGTGSFDIYQSANPPAVFGSGPSTFAASGAGPLIGADGLGNIGVPVGYNSGDLIAASTATWTGTDFATLGITPGVTRTWTWGTGPDADFFTVTTVPEPSAFMFLGLVSAGGIGASIMRKRKATAQIEAADQES